MLDRDQALVDDRVHLGEHGLDPLARVDRLGDQRQVRRDVGEAPGVDPAPDPEPFDPAVQRRDLEAVAREAVDQRLVGRAAAAVQRLAEVDVELQAPADHAIACPAKKPRATRPKPSTIDSHRLRSSSTMLPISPSRTLSTIHVENVVYPPAKPVPRRKVTRPDETAPFSTPRPNAPVRLTANVPSGKSLGRRAETAASARNRAIAPSAPKHAAPIHVSTLTNAVPTARAAHRRRPAPYPPRGSRRDTPRQARTRRGARTAASRTET